ncbi:flavin-dependent reductase [Actinorhabdospora filicis]|uniref:Flavin-dependent reductase n=1 Tax=Actinorhabdospora filicis TaxID=1785913 RepID=A0A9W6SNK1_9ACTN|nr:flavin reductase family protein [Actinorhabdospora filicis]GLZ79152.1 flavin-dependent reductase [Actinorhabdospora filicis]
MTVTDARPAADTLLRRTFGQFATGVAVVTTAGPDGPAGLTVNSVASVSLNPPLMLWCLRQESASLEVFSTCRAFAVNVLAAGQSEVARTFATRDHPDRFGTVSWTPGHEGAPVLSGVTAWLVCRRTSPPIPAGDHVVVFGEVVRHHAFGGEPLVFAQSRFRRLCGEEP